MGIIADTVEELRSGRRFTTNSFLAMAAFKPDDKNCKGYLVAPLEQALEREGVILDKTLHVGSTALVSLDTPHKEATRITYKLQGFDLFKPLESDICVLPAANKELIIPDSEGSRPNGIFSLQVRPLGVSECKDGSIGKEDMLTVAAILHSRGQLSHWGDLDANNLRAAQDKLMYLPDSKGDVLRFSNGKPIPFLVDTNSLMADGEEAIASYGSGRDGSDPDGDTSARRFLKEAFGCKDDAALDALLEKRLRELPKDWKESLKQQDHLLEAIRQRHGMAEPGWAGGVGGGTGQVRVAERPAGFSRPA